MMYQQQPMMYQQQPMMYQQQPMMYQQQPMTQPMTQPTTQQAAMYQQPDILSTGLFGPTIVMQPVLITNHPIRSKTIIMERGMYNTSRGRLQPYIARVYCCGPNGCRSYVNDDGGCSQGCVITFGILFLIATLIAAVVLLADSGEYNHKRSCTLEGITTSYCDTNGGSDQYSYTYDMYIASCGESFEIADSSCTSHTYSYSDIGNTYTCYTNSACTKATLTAPTTDIGIGIGLIFFALLIWVPCIVYCTRIYLFVFRPFTYKQYCCYKEDQ